MALCRTGIVLGLRCAAGVLQIPHMMRATPHPFKTRPKACIVGVSVHSRGLATEFNTRPRTSVTLGSHGVATAAIPQEVGMGWVWVFCYDFEEPGTLGMGEVRPLDEGCRWRRRSSYVSSHMRLMRWDTNTWISDPGNSRRG
jgi:hypothetical protein